MSATIKERIHLLHQSPLTPLFLLKTKHGEVFDVHKDSVFLAPHLKEMFMRVHEIATRSNLRKIPLKEISMPDISFALEVKRDGDFSTFIPKHQNISSRLTKIFLEMTDLNDLASVIAYIRDRIHPKMFFYALAVALNHRKDTSNLTSDILSAFPTNFISTQSISEARSRDALGLVTSPEDPITPPQTGTYIDEEYRTAFFREDLAVNSHHWHWHIVYPHDNINVEIVAKDRRGELFFYMHQQMMARLNMERLCALLPRVVPFFNFKESFVQGYYPKLRTTNASQDIPGRPSNLAWSDINRINEFSTTVNNMIAWRSRIEQAIDTGSVVIDQENITVEKDGTRIIRHKDLNIDMLGNMVEASMLSPNKDMYGDLHNSGHVFTAYVHDPNRKYLEPMGVMGDTATAIRDPFFFRWHGLIDEIFQRFKTSKMSPPYKPADLLYKDIVVQSVEVVEDPTFIKSVLSVDERNKMNGNISSDFHTFWMNSVVKVDGLNFQMEKSLYVNYKHLDHVPFSYKIQIMNNQAARKGTVRIFMAPKLDENRVDLELRDQRRLFAELDRFIVDLNPGLNTIQRKSTESSVTIPLEQSFPESLVTPNPPTMSELYCRCGWPQHLLLPKGMPTGGNFQIFVMVSDYEKDKVIVKDNSVCKESSSFCGLKDNKYPDARSMGYPFDRLMDSQYNYVSDLVANNSNMMIKDVLVKFTDITVKDPRSKTN